MQLDLFHIPYITSLRLAMAHEPIMAKQTKVMYLTLKTTFEIMNHSIEVQ